MSKRRHVLVVTTALLCIATSAVVADPLQELIDLRLRAFVGDLVAHDYDELWLHLDAGYIATQLGVMEAESEPLSEEVLDQLLFNGAVMFDNYKTTFHSVMDISSVRVTDVSETAWGDLEVHFLAILNDGREIGFSLLVNQQTAMVYGAAG